MKPRLLISVCFLIFLPATSLADGNEILNYCESAASLQEGKKLTNKELQHGVYCIGYLSGMMDLNSVYGALPKQRRLFCPPVTVQRSQAVRAVIKYLRDHPEKLRELPVTLAIEALRNAFPCPQ